MTALNSDLDAYLHAQVRGYTVQCSWKEAQTDNMHHFGHGPIQFRVGCDPDCFSVPNPQLLTYLNIRTGVHAQWCGGGIMRCAASDRPSGSGTEENTAKYPAPQPGPTQKKQNTMRFVDVYRLAYGLWHCQLICPSNSYARRCGQ